MLKSNLVEQNRKVIPEGSLSIKKREKDTEREKERNEEQWGW